MPAADLPGFLPLDGIRFTTEEATTDFRGTKQKERRFYFREAVVDRLLDIRPMETVASETDKDTKALAGL